MKPEPGKGYAMLTVNNILESKGSEIWSVTPETSILQALKFMDEKNIGALLVLQHSDLVGIFSERDFARRAVAVEDLELDTPVRALMTSPVYGVSPDQSLNDCMQIMTQGHFRHLPVTENGRLVGLISIGDVVKQIISEKQSTIDSLVDYIWVNLI